MSGCNHSWLNPRRPVQKATIGVFLPNASVDSYREDIPIDEESVTKMLPALSQTTHLSHEGCPHSRLLYVLTIEQGSLTEMFWFLNDFESSGFTTSEENRYLIKSTLKAVVEKAWGHNMPELKYGDTELWESIK